jgi:hypothetical protein
MSFEDYMRMGKLREAIDYLYQIAKKSGILALINSALDLKSRCENWYLDGKSDKNQESALTKQAIALNGKFNGAYDIISESFISYCSKTLIHKCRWILWDRDGFKKELKKCITEEGAKFLIVKKMTNQIGLSYLRYYLMHLKSLNSLYDYYEINLGSELTDDSFDFIHFLGLKLSIPMNKNDDLPVKNETFITKLKEKLCSTEKIPIIFIHDFQHHAVINPDIYKSLIRLMDEFQHMEEFKIIIILAGLDTNYIPNYSFFQAYINEYSLEEINIGHISESINILYNEYYLKTNAEHMDFEEYKAKVLNLCGFPNWNVSKTSSVLNNHLQTMIKSIDNE